MGNGLRVCFTGHRPKYLQWGYDETKPEFKVFRDKLKITINELIARGARTFLTGMAEGFDMIAAELILELKAENNDIELIAVIPCEEQEKRWSISQQERYRNLLEKCDECKVLSKYYTRDCMLSRNKYLIENSDFCVACWNGRPSGTGMTVRLAEKKGLIVISPE